MTASMSFIDLAAQQERLRPELDKAIATVLDHGRYVMGPEVGQLEAALGRLTGAAHAVSCASGTDALVLALLALGVGPGDAVIVPTFTFAATAEAVALLGATPVFADVDASTFNINADQVADALGAARDGGLDPVGVIPVDLFGLPADYRGLQATADREGIWILADAAQSLGGSTPIGKVGTLASITTTSFFPAKPLGCYGDGGAVFCGEAEVDAILRSLRVHGQGADKYENVRIGINGRLDTLQAAILLVKLTVFDDEIVARGRAAATYGELLADAVGVPAVAEGTVSAWAQYTILVDDRDRIASQLRAAGVPTAVYYPRPLHQQAAYRGFPCSSDLSTSESLSERVLSLPMHPYLTAADQERVAEGVLVAQREARGG